MERAFSISILESKEKLLELMKTMKNNKIFVVDNINEIIKS